MGWLIIEDVIKVDVVIFDLKKGDSFIFLIDILSWCFEGDLMIIVLEFGSC